MKMVNLILLSLCVTCVVFGQPDEHQTITGKIVDTEGQPIPKAKVALYYHYTRWGMDNRISEQTESGPDGLFAFKNPLTYSDTKGYPYGSDSYILLASHPDYAFGWKKIDRNREQLGYEVTLTEPKSKTITVTDHDGNPLANARVWPYNVGNRSDSEPLFRDYLSLPTYVDIVGGTTGADGKATINNLPKTRSSFYAQLKGYAKGLSFSGDRPIRLSKGATVSGTILDEDGNPVKEALVKFHTKWMWNFFLTRTDSQGKFLIEDLPAEGWDMSPWGNSEGANGIYVITMEYSDYIASETQDQFQPGQVVKDFNIEAYRGTLIKCHVVDVKSNLPVAGARIRGSNESGRISGRTDADGVLNVRVISGRTSLFFGSPPEDVYILRGENPSESSLRFDAQGKEMTVTLKSPPIAGRLTTVKGKVVLPDGSPAADLRISTTNSADYETLTWAGAGGAYTGTSSDGTFELKNVPAGLKLLLYGITNDHQYILAEVIENVTVPTELSRPLVMKAGQVADVALFDKWGKTCTNMSVKIKPVMWDNRVFRARDRIAKTDEKGRLKIDGILPDLHYYITDARERSGPSEMHYTQTMVLISSKVNTKNITSFEGIDIDFDVNQAKNQMLLFCIFDMNQRPSRHCIRQLTEKAKQLEERNITIVAIQALETERNVLKEWKGKNAVPFPMGQIKVDEHEQVISGWRGQSLPWLMLTDKEHIVRVEGFELDELEEKIREIENVEK